MRLWIQACSDHTYEEDAQLLLQLGIELGSYDSEEREWWPCKASGRSLFKLDDQWGRFIWGDSRIR